MYVASLISQSARTYKTLKYGLVSLGHGRTRRLYLERLAKTEIIKNQLPNQAVGNLLNSITS